MAKNYTIKEQTNTETPSEAPPAPIPNNSNNLVAVDAGALTMVLNALKRDEENGLHVRGDMARELERTCATCDAITRPYLTLLEYRDERIKMLEKLVVRYRHLVNEANNMMQENTEKLNRLVEDRQGVSK